MELLNTMSPSPHFGHFLLTSPFAIAFAFAPASPSTFLLGHFGLRQNSIGCFALFIAKTIGKLQTSQFFLAGFMKAFFGSEKIVLQSGYLLQEAKLPNFPLLIVMFPSLHTGQMPIKAISSCVALLASESSLPISFSCFLKSPMIFVIASLASSSRFSFFWAFSLIFSISSSKCLVSSSSIILGQYFSRVSIVDMPSSVASIAFPCTYPLWNNVSTISDLVALVPRFLFSSSFIIEAGVYLFGAWVSLLSSSILLTFILSFCLKFGSSISSSLT